MQLHLVSILMGTSHPLSSLSFELAVCLNPIYIYTGVIEKFEGNNGPRSLAEGFIFNIKVYSCFADSLSKISLRSLIFLRANAKQKNLQLSNAKFLGCLGRSMSMF